MGMVRRGRLSMSEPVRVLSDAHRRVIRLLEMAGLEIMEEVGFPPYQIDIYIPDCHAAVEVDGPHHRNRRRRDRRRDILLIDRYSLPTFRVPMRGRGWEEEFGRFLRLAKETARERWEIVKDRLPHL